MPYEVLDTLERAAIRDKKGPQLMPAKSSAQPYHPAYSREKQHSTGPKNSTNSGAATSGSANATPSPSTSTTKISTPSPGAASPSSPPDSAEELSQL